MCEAACMHARMHTKLQHSSRLNYKHACTCKSHVRLHIGIRIKSHAFYVAIYVRVRDYSYNYSG